MKGFFDKYADPKEYYVPEKVKKKLSKKAKVDNLRDLEKIYK